LPATTSSGNYLISGLAAGFYTVTIANEAGCAFVLYNVEVKQGVGNNIAAPEAVTPQIFCSEATVANLQTITGVNIVWFDSETGGTPLPEDTELEDEHIYYAAQTLFGCNRTAVKAIIDDGIFVDTPNLPAEIELCPPATLADVPTNGNTNLRWYDGEGNMVNPEDVQFEAGHTYYYTYVGLTAGGDCESIRRVEITIIIVDEVGAPEMEQEQHFCPGAIIANIATPNNKIVWYFEETDEEPLNVNTKLVTHTYWAAQKAGSCESDERTPVEVFIDQYPKPVVPPNQCYKPDMTLSDLMVIGTNIKWYEDEVGGTALPSNTLVTKPEYWAAQSSGDCESERIKITLIPECYDINGTVFPFVQLGDATFDKQFITTAKLYLLPPENIFDKIGYVRKQPYLQALLVTYYDCHNDAPIVGAPKYPGAVGATNNPGLPIRWDMLGITDPGTVNTTELSLSDPCPTREIGKYFFKTVAPGEYVLEIARQGFLTRYGVIKIEKDGYIGHRELLGGDVNGDMMIDSKDLSAIRPKMSVYGLPNYMWKYDLNGDKNINEFDIQVIFMNLNAYSTIYQEAEDWINP
jgi:hypothetical protein